MSKINCRTAVLFEDLHEVSIVRLPMSVLQVMDLTVLPSFNHLVLLFLLLAFTVWHIQWIHSQKQVPFYFAEVTIGKLN